MKIKKAIDEAKQMEKIKQILEEGGHLCSVFTKLQENEKQIEKWQLGFYDKKEDKITAVEVGNSAKIGITDKPLNSNPANLKVDKIKTEAENVLKKSKNIFSNEYSGKYRNILLSLKAEDKKQYWNAVFFTGQLDAISIKIDSKDGKVLEHNKSSLIEMR